MTLIDLNEDDDDNDWTNHPEWDPDSLISRNGVPIDAESRPYFILQLPENLPNLLRTTKSPTKLSTGSPRTPQAATMEVNVYDNLFQVRHWDDGEIYVQAESPRHFKIYKIDRDHLQQKHSDIRQY
jgi:hypothetical protein